MAGADVVAVGLLGAWEAEGLSEAACEGVVSAWVQNICSAAAAVAEEDGDGDDGDAVA